MSIKFEVNVLQITIDLDATAGEFLRIDLGFKLATPEPKVSQVMNEAMEQFKAIMPPQMMRPAFYYKHLLHIMIPKDRWDNQYQVGDVYDMEITEEGQMTLKLKRVQGAGK